MQRIVRLLRPFFVVLAVIATGLVMSAAGAPAAGRLVYIGTYTGEASKGIYAFRFDDRTGELTPLGLVAETPSPSFLTASADGRFVFAVNELQSFAGGPIGSVTSFAVDPASAKLTEISVQATRGNGPCHLVLDRTGRYSPSRTMAAATSRSSRSARTASSSPRRRDRRPSAETEDPSRWATWWASTRQPVPGHRRQRPEPDARVPLRCGARHADAQRPAVGRAAAEVRAPALRVSSEREWLFTINEQARHDHDVRVGREDGQPYLRAACRRGRRR